MSSNNSTEPASSTPPASSSAPPTTDLSSFTSSVQSTAASETPSTTSVATTPTPTPTSTSQPPTTTQATSADATSTTTAPSRSPTTVVHTSVVSDSSGGAPSTVVVTVTSSQSQSTVAPATTANTAQSSAATSSAGPNLQPGSKSSSGGGLSSGGKTAVAVVVPVVVVALLVLGGIFLWKKRKQRKSAEEARRKEVEDYNFNPNTDPTLPVVAGGSEMAEDSVGYRGWGNTTTSNRHPSTTLSGGHTQPSDTGSNPGGYHSPGSPTNAALSEGGSGDPLMAGRRTTMDSETVGALGAGPVASANTGGVRRGPSNASSSYSAANHSDHSGEAPIPLNNPQDYYTDNSYYQGGPYAENAYGVGQQPVIQNVQARRNTRIENPSVFPQQGNTGISANF